MAMEPEDMSQGRRLEPTPVQIQGTISSDVSLKRTATTPTADQPLWVAIRNRARALSFNRYQNFVNRVLCEDGFGDDPSNPATPQGSATVVRPGNEGHGRYGLPSVAEKRLNLVTSDLRPTIHGMDAYKLLKLATEAFLIFECGVVMSDDDRFGDDPTLFDTTSERRRLGHMFDTEDHTTNPRYEDPIDRVQQYLEAYLTTEQGNILPYFDRIVRQIAGLAQDRRREDTPYCEAILQRRLTCPSMLELIWSYWHEEGMLVQTLNAIALRFQNKRFGGRDPLINLELDPLRPLNNIIWGFVQDDYNRLSVQRRAYEYDHHYGFSLIGKAVPHMQSADSRSKFVAAFHNLLYRTAMFYREDDDATIVADAFALLNALRDVHIILAEGALQSVRGSALDSA